MPNYNQSSLALKGKKYFLIVLSLLALVTIIWIFLSLFSSQKTSSIDKKVSELAKPLKPNLNTVALDKIAEKTEFSEEELKSFPIRIFNYDVKTKLKTLHVIEAN